MQEQSLFIEALEKEDPAERAAFLEQVCAGDPPLRQRIDRLLERHGQGGSFLEGPSAGLVATAAEPTSECPGTVIGPYKLREQIGEGGMGLVFVAEQLEPVRRKVALKLIKPGMDSRQVIARFEAERQALALMDHPNIAKVFDGGATPGGRPFFVMELVKGAPITEYCDDNRLTPRARLELFSHVCSAVQHAHQKGIIHRDIKPSNVLVVSHDGTPVVKVIDFGVAKAVGQQLTDKSVYTDFAQFVGTPLYMSPEQAGQSGLDVDTRTDIYALGVLLYELLTGTTPFDRERLREASYEEIRRVIREEEPPKPSTRLSTLGQAGTTVFAQRQSEPKQLCKLLRGELDWIVMKALDKDRNRRYESASALAADVQRYLQDEPVQACPPSRRYRLGKFLRKHRRGVLTAAGVLVVAVVLAGGIGYVVSDRASRLAKIEQKVEVALGGARTAIDAGDLNLARQRVADAQAHLGTESERSPASDAESRRLLSEIDARQGDQTRFRLFLKLTGEAQNTMRLNEGSDGDVVARRAFDVYGVLEVNDWLASLDNSYLTAADKEQVREAAYLTLVTVADWGARWSSDPKRVERSLFLLERAQSFHELTRAFYFVRSECNRRRGNTTAAEEDTKQFKAAPARTAWDHFLPGHTAGWRGDFKEAIRSYLSALALQPDHYDSLYFLAMRLSNKEINRVPEALYVFTACIALRPSDYSAYASRGTCYFDLGQLEEAQRDYTTAIALAQKNEKEFESYYWGRYHVYQALGRMDNAGQDLERLIMLGEQTLAQKLARLGAAHTDTLHSQHELAQAYQQAGKLDQADLLLRDLLKRERKKEGAKAIKADGLLAILGRNRLLQQRYVEAEPLLRECAAIRAKQLPDDWRRYNAVSMLGDALLGQRKYAMAEPLLLEGYEGMKQREAKIPAQGRIRMTEAVERIVRLYEATEQVEKARAWREMLPANKGPVDQEEPSNARSGESSGMKSRNWGDVPANNDNQGVDPGRGPRY